MAYSKGETVGEALGDEVGEMDGVKVFVDSGEEFRLVGLWLAEGESLDVGDVDGDFVGKLDGDEMEDSVGLVVGKEVGEIVGEVLGLWDGDAV